MTVPSIREHRLDVWHVDPDGMTTIYAPDGPTYHATMPARLVAGHAGIGHRTTFYVEWEYPCPRIRAGFPPRDVPEGLLRDLMRWYARELHGQALRHG